MNNKRNYDFADETPHLENKDIIVEEENYRHLKIKKINVKKDVDNFQKKGNYLSFEISDLDEKTLSKNKIDIIVKTLYELVKKQKVKDNPHVLMVGLGNDDFSSDALGPETIKKINANSYIKHLDKKISCIIPGVMKTTGLESASIIKSLVNEFKFDLVIVFDSLTTINPNRLFKVIQITDTEIVPGSGIKNYRQSLNSKSLGVPLIAVGVSMAILYSTIIENVLNHVEYPKKIKKDDKKYLLDQLNNELILTSKDSEIRVKTISYNLSQIFNRLFA